MMTIYASNFTVAPCQGGDSPPPLLKLVGKLVILSESSWSSIPAYTQARRVLVRKSATKAIITFLSGNIFYQESCRRGGGGGGDSLSEKYCPWPPKKHGTHDAPAMLPFSAVFKKHHRNL